MPQQNIPEFTLPDSLISKYVNFVRISHTASEFVLDFSLLLPGVDQPEVDSRLVMSPTAVKLFLHALTENLSRYESKFGQITLPGKLSLADDLFHPNTQPEEPDGK